MGELRWLCWVEVGQGVVATRLVCCRGSVWPVCILGMVGGRRLSLCVILVVVAPGGCYRDAH